MAILQISANRSGAGKTSLAAALLLHLASEGQRVAYYKPFSPAGEDDLDAEFLSQHLTAESASSPAPSTSPLPTMLAAGATPEEPLLAAARSHAAHLESRSDLVLVEGPDLADPQGEPWTLALALSSALESRVLLLFWYTKDLTAAMIADACKPFGGRLAGVIINGVTAYRTRDAADGLAAELRAHGVPILGTVSEDRAMLGVSVQQIADYLGGRWVQEPENTDAHVERLLIGGNIMDAGPTYFGRYPNQAVVTRAARPDIQMASLTSDIVCLVLTGGDEPAEYVKAEAMQRGVPMILVDGSTMETAEALGGLLDIATARTEHKIRRFLYLLQRGVDLEALTALA